MTLEREIARKGMGVTHCANMVMEAPPLFKGCYFAVSETADDSQGW